MRWAYKNSDKTKVKLQPICHPKFTIRMTFCALPSFSLKAGRFFADKCGKCLGQYFALSLEEPL